MDPAQGESGGGKSSLSSKLKAKVPRTGVKDKVKNLKSRLPGLKKHNVDQDESHEDSSEYDDNSPRSPGPGTGYNVADSTLNSNSPRISPRDVHNPDYDYRPAQTGYDAHDVAAAPPTRPAPLAADAPHSNLAPAALEENFQHLGVGDKTSTDPTPTDSSFQPEQQQRSSYSPSTAESVQKDYSDAPRNNSYRSNASSSPTSNKGILEKVKETVAGATAVLGDKVGYYNDHAPADPNAPSLLAKAKSTLGVDRPRDPNAPSILAKAKSSLGTKDPNAPPLTERAKAYINVASQKTREYSATAADHAAWTKDRVATQATPTHHDKALSEQVTQSLSSLPGAIKEKVFGPASPGSAKPSPSSPGIVDRVSGAVSSLFTSSPKATGANLQHTFPAHSDHDASAPSAPADRSSVPPTTSPPDYSTVNN